MFVFFNSLVIISGIRDDKWFPDDFGRIQVNDWVVRDAEE